MLGRIGLPEEVASVASFLVIDEASFIKAETIQVGGGQVLGIQERFSLIANTL